MRAQVVGGWQQDLRTVGIPLLNRHVAEPIEGNAVLPVAAEPVAPVLLLIDRQTLPSLRESRTSVEPHDE